MEQTDIQIYTRFRQHSQYNLADWVQPLVSSEVCSHGYGLPSLNRNYNPLSRLYR